MTALSLLSLSMAITTLSLLLLSVVTVYGFHTPSVPQPRWRRAPTPGRIVVLLHPRGDERRPFVPLSLSSSLDEDNEERQRQIFQEEALNVENMKASAAAMKDLKPEDIDRMMAEMERMPASQSDMMKKMGMDPSLMKQSLEMMKRNPAMMRTMGTMMENMSPEELMEQSRIAQQQMKAASNTASPSTTATTASRTSTPASVVDAEIANDDEEEEEEEADDEEPIEPSQYVLDTMFAAAELMSEPSSSSSSGTVTFRGFCTVPPVAVLAAGTGEDALSDEELLECWNKGSLGADRVDKAGFKRVWMEVQDNYYGDIMDEARDAVPSRAKSVAANPITPPPPSSSSSSATTMPMAGQSVPTELLSEQLKNMKESDVEEMLERMGNMSPEEEARMKAMGVDPTLMKRSAKMMNNPLMRKGLATVMKNTSPEDLVKQSQMAQERLSNMSEEDRKKMMENMGG